MLKPLCVSLVDVCYDRIKILTNVCMLTIVQANLRNHQIVLTAFAALHGSMSLPFHFYQSIYQIFAL